MDYLVSIILLFQLIIPIAVIVFIIRILIIQKRLKDEVENLNIQIKDIINNKNEKK